MPAAVSARLSAHSLKDNSISHIQKKNLRTRMTLKVHEHQSQIINRRWSKLEQRVWVSPRETRGAERTVTQTLPLVTCGERERRAAARGARAGPGPRSSTAACRRTCTAWRWPLLEPHRRRRRETESAGANRSRSSRVTVTVFRKMKHKPTGGGVRGGDRRRGRLLWQLCSARSIATAAWRSTVRRPRRAKIESTSIRLV